MTAYPNRNLRNLDIIPSQKLTDINCVVIGVGAIGRQIALQLSAIGVNSLELVDFDIVEEVNLGPQGYYESDLGKAKVEATMGVCRQINSEITLIAHTMSFEDATLNMSNTAVFCCVDSINSRRLIWNRIRRHKQLWVDGRMLGETLRILTSDGEHDEYYRTTLFRANEAAPGRCTARSTIYSSNVIAGMMVAQFTRWLRGDYFQPDILFNLATMDMCFLDLEPAAA